LRLRGDADAFASMNGASRRRADA